MRPTFVLVSTDSAGIAFIVCCVELVSLHAATTGNIRMTLAIAKPVFVVAFTAITSIFVAVVH